MTPSHLTFCVVAMLCRVHSAASLITHTKKPDCCAMQLTVTLGLTAMSMDIVRLKIFMHGTSMGAAAHHQVGV